MKFLRAVLVYADSADFPRLSAYMVRIISFRHRLREASPAMCLWYAFIDDRIVYTLHPANDTCWSMLPPLNPPADAALQGHKFGKATLSLFQQNHRSDQGKSTIGGRESLVAVGVFDRMSLVALLSFDPISVQNKSASSIHSRSLSTPLNFTGITVYQSQ